jgi:Rieske Fe-S protein
MTMDPITTAPATPAETTDTAPTSRRHSLGVPAPAGVSRRVVSLGGIGMAAVSVGLAACSAPAQTATPEETPSPSSGESGGSGASGDAGGAPIVALADVPVGGAVAVDIDGAPCIVAQPTAGSVVAFTAICTHQGCKVAPAGAQLNCPCHGSQFDAFTGEVKHGPAEAPLTALAVAVKGDEVVKA